MTKEKNVNSDSKPKKKRDLDFLWTIGLILELAAFFLLIRWIA